MVYFSIVSVIMLVVVVTLMLYLGLQAGKRVSRLTIEDRIKFDKYAFILMGCLTIVFIVQMLISMHVFDPTLFKNQYDYRYMYHMSDGETTSGVFDMYRNEMKLEVDGTILSVMSFMEREDEDLPNNVYYKVKVVSNNEYNYDISCNGITYRKVFATASTMNTFNNDELALFCESGDTITVTLENEFTEEIKSSQFVYNLKFEGFRDIPKIEPVNGLYTFVMMFVFITFLYLLYKKVRLAILNNALDGNVKPIKSKIVLSVITFGVLTVLTILSLSVSDLVINTYDVYENDVYLIDRVRSEEGDVQFRYNYVTDTLYFKPVDFEGQIDLIFDDYRYTDLREINFNQLEEINREWYQIDNVEEYEILKIVIYDELGSILIEDELTLLHPYYE